MDMMEAWSLELMELMEGCLVRALHDSREDMNQSFESVHIEINMMKNDIQWEITAQVTEKYAVLEDLIADTHERNTMSK